MSRRKINFRHLPSKKVTYTLIPLLSLILGLSVIKKTIELSERPSQEKNCHLLYPFNTKDPEKITQIILKPQDNLPMSQTEIFLAGPCVIKTFLTFR